MSRLRLQGLDLLRGLAILLVVIRHAWPEVVGGAGIVGVVIFFALSGYLITGLLTDDLRRYGRVRYGRFYLHRAARLLPALVAMLAIFAAITVTFDPIHEGAKNAAWGVFTGMTYTANIPGWPRAEALGHLWTLATEEQYYLVWPVVLAIGFYFGRAKLIAALFAVAVMVGLVASLLIRSDNVASIYTMPFSWAIAIVIGSIASLCAARLTRILPSAGRARGLLSLGALAVLLALCGLPEVKAYPAIYLVGGPLIAVSTVVLIFHLSTWQVIPVAWLRPLLWLGMISYAAYLWNYPITKWLAGSDHELDGLMAWASIPLTLAAAMLSWFLVERPAQRLRRRIETALRSRDLLPALQDTPARSSP